MPDISQIQSGNPIVPAEPTYSVGRKNWGRKWRVTIQSWDFLAGPSLNSEDFSFTEVLTIEQIGWVPEGLHIQFNTVQYPFDAWWSCDVVIWNLNAAQSQTVINYGMTCTVEAGYIDGAFGTVFEGTIFQPIWEKERGVDWKLTLRCIIGIVEVGDNFINATVSGGKTQRQLAAQMLGEAKYPIGLTMKGIDDIQLTRATTHFGQPNDLLQYIANSTNSLLWFKHRWAYMQTLEDQTDKIPQWEFGPDNGLIGTPDQTQEGANITVLMQPDLQLMGQVKIKQDVVIKQLQRQLGVRPMNIPGDFTYIIGRIRHYGDSRGNDWYSEITGFYNVSSLLSLMVQ